MRTAVSISLFSVLLFHGCVRAEEWKSYRSPDSGFTAEFTGAVKEIDLKPDAKTRGYILRTSIFEQVGRDFSYSITAREYRFGTPDVQSLGHVIADRLHCSTNVKTAPIAGGGLALSGDGCLANGSSFVARLLTRGRWFYQALAVVPPNGAKDAGQFVAALKLSDMSRPQPPRRKTVARRHTGRKTPRRTKAARRAPLPPTRALSGPFIADQNWRSRAPANPAAPDAQYWFGSYARAP